MPAPACLSRHARARLGAAAVALLPAALAWAQAPPSEPGQPGPPARSPSDPPAPPSQSLDRVEIRGGRLDEVQERRQSTAAKIIIGRDDIERFGDTTLGDLIKRLPGVTVQGQPGRGGQIRLRGLGNGYTQILIDGERVPPGFSLDSLAPDQIERIEILRAPTAETGARAIAGTINIITRGGYTRRVNDVKLTAGVENGRLQPHVAWNRNDTAGPFVYNFSVSAYQQNRANDATTTTVDQDLATGDVLLNQRDTGTAREHRNGLHFNGRLQWRGEEAGHSLVLTPFVIGVRGRTHRTGHIDQFVPAVPPSGCLSAGLDAPPDTCLYTDSVTDGSGDYTLARLNAQYNRRVGDLSRIELRGGLGDSHWHGHSLREETTHGVLSRTLEDSTDNHDRSANVGAKLFALHHGDHNLVTGLEAEQVRRSDDHSTLQDGVPILVDFGGNVTASSLRQAAFVQDEWNLTERWAVHAGLRWEGIETKGSAEVGQPVPTNRSSVWSPLLHAVWKPDPKGRDQVRMSLTRSYRAPALGDLVARPAINPRFDPTGPNTPTQPDRAGNPDLMPELATGIDIAFERYLPGSGILSANLFHRAIRNYMRSQVSLETVPWSPVPRWVSRPQNIGDATTQGLELEAKFRISDLVEDAPRLDVRANASIFGSRVKSVAGPDNRLDQQPDYTVNLGADWRSRRVPLTLGGNLNWTPGYRTQVSDDQAVLQGRKLVIDVYALWTFSPTAQVRLSASNVDPRDYITGRVFDDTASGVRETSTTTAPTFVNVQLRLELKL
jgi:iron complex outermembrane receptor protein